MRSLTPSLPLATLVAALLCLLGMTVHVAAAGAQPTAQAAAVPTEGSYRDDITASEACAELDARRDCTFDEAVTACVARGISAGECATWLANTDDQPTNWVHNSTTRLPLKTKTTNKPKRARPKRTTTSAGGAGDPADDGSSASGDDASGDADASGTVGSNDDILSSNGIVSPTCRKLTNAGAAVQRARDQTAANCAQTGSAFTSAIGSHLGFDIHVDTTTRLGAPKFDNSVDKMFLSFMLWGWSLAVMVLRLLYSSLEWAFSFNPLDRDSVGPIADQLRTSVRTITLPILACTLTCGAVWVVVQGVRGRLAAAMHAAVETWLLILVGLVALYNPWATACQLLAQGQQGGVAILATTAGNPGAGSQSLETALQSMFTATVEQPLAVLEFGDAHFGTDPDRLVPELKRAATKLARDDPKERQAVAAAHNNIELFMAFKTNGPERNAINNVPTAGNGSSSISAPETSLLRVLCQNDDATNCRGPYADFAEFRTQSGTSDRLLLSALITVGMLAVYLILGWITFELLGAAISVLVRLLGLVWVICMVGLGQSGRDRYKRYGIDTLGACLASTWWAAVLGVYFDVWRILSLSGTEKQQWLAQWLLIDIATIYMIVKRKALLGAVRRSPTGVGDVVAWRLASRTRRSARKARQRSRSGLNGRAREARSRFQNPFAFNDDRSRTPFGGKRTSTAMPNATPPAPAPRRRQTTAQPASETRPVVDRSAPAGVPAVIAEHVDAARQAVADRTGVSGGSPIARGRSSSGAVPSAPRYPQNVERARERQNDRLLAGISVAAKDDWAATSARAERDRPRLDRRQAALAELQPLVAAERDPSRRARLRRREVSLLRRMNDSQRIAEAPARARRRVDASRMIRVGMGPGEWRRQDLQRADGFLDAQAAKRRGAGTGADRRDYRRLASLRGVGAEQYDAASPQQQLATRAAIDRELNQRAGLAPRQSQRPAATTTPATPTPLTGAEVRDQAVKTNARRARTAAAGRRQSRQNTPTKPKPTPMRPGRVVPPPPAAA